MSRFKYVRYERDHEGVRAGEYRVLNPYQAADRERDAIVTIIDHPRFPHKAAKEFAGLPAPIPEARERKRR